MDTFRRFSRRAWLLHGYLLASLILWPVPTARCYWTRDAFTNARVEITDPPVGDSWWDQDGDLDGLTNAQEVAFGSDAFQRDSDGDGLTDADERDITPAMLGGLITTDPWNWDSDANGYSDHDEYWAWQSGLALNVNYADLTPPSPLPPDYYRDIDGDGIYNLWDHDPADGSVTSPPPPDPSAMDSDWDGHVDASDSHPYTNWLWEDWNGNGTNDSQEYYYWYPSDSDSDGYADSSDSDPYASWLWEDWNRNGTNDSLEPLPTSPLPDDDGDTCPNSSDSDPTNASLWEDWNRNGINDSSESPDGDGDGVSDADEATAGTHPYFHDSDGDGLSDGEERTAQTNPLQVDTDGDGLTDHEEIFIFQTNPLLAHSQLGQQQTDYHQVNLTDGDLDGIPDLVEAWYGRDPVSDADAGCDLDMDGHADLDAYLVGWSFTVSFTSYDQDRDGLTNAREAYWGLNPYDPDDATRDADHDGLLNMEEIHLGLDLFCASTHGMPDLQYANATWSLGWQPCLSPGASATALDDDTDGDGMSDVWEHRHRLELRDPSDAIRDPDKDSLSNLTEFRFQTHPRIPKSESNTHDRSRLYATGKPLKASTTGGLMNRYRAQMVADAQISTNLPQYSMVRLKQSPNTQSLHPLSGGGGGGERPRCRCGEKVCHACQGSLEIPCESCHRTGRVTCKMQHEVYCPPYTEGSCTGHGYQPCGGSHTVACDHQTTVEERTCQIHTHQLACFGQACEEEENLHIHGFTSNCDLDEDGVLDCGMTPHTHQSSCYEIGSSRVLVDWIGFEVEPTAVKEDACAIVGE